MKIDYASLIKDCVSMQDVIGMYLSGVQRRGNRIACPFHGGKMTNLGFNRNAYNCFVCGEKGDTLQFVKKLFSLTFPETIAKLNDDFALGLPISSSITPSEAEILAQRQKEIRNRLAEEERKKNEEEQKYWRLYDTLITYDIAKTRYAPKSPDEPLNPKFIEALHNYERAKHEFERYS